MSTGKSDRSSSPLERRRPAAASRYSVLRHAPSRPLDTDDDLGVLRSGLERYDVLDRVDHGGQGTVYRAKQRGTARTVAIKVLLDGPLAGERQRYRFEREIELVSRLNHPNIVALHESGIVRGRLYFSMDFVEGLRIDDYAILHDLSPREIVRLMLPVCRAIHFAHQRGVIHRDLKPNHILIDESGEPRVLDFGLAKDVLDNSGNVLHSCTGQVVGTLPYLSPEQAGGFDGKADVRSDVYALGLVLYQLLTDLMPYPIDGAPEDVRRAIVSHDPLPLRKAAGLGRATQTPHQREINRDLELILHRALSKEKELRYQTAADLADDLERYLQGEAVAAVGDSAWYSLRKTLRRHRAAVAVSGAIAAILVAATVLVSIVAVDARRQRDVARSAAGAAAEMLGFALREIEGAVRPLPGGVEVRDRLLAHLDGELADLERIAQSDPALSSLSLTLLEKQGDMAVEKGDTTRGLAAYRELVARLARDRARAGGLSGIQRIQHAVALRKRGELSGPDAASIEESVRELRAIVNERPQDAIAGSELVRSHMALAGARKHGGDIEAAIRELDSAEAVLSEPVFAAQVQEAARLRAALRITRSGFWRNRGRGGDALADLYSGLEMLEGVAAAAPTNTDIKLDLMRAYRSAAQVELQRGNVERATELQRSGHEMGERLAALDPKSTRWDEIRLRTLQDIVATMCDTGSAAATGPYVAAAREIAMRAEPGSDAALEFSSRVHEMAGRSAQDMSNFAAAVEHFSSAAALRETLVERAPADIRGRLHAAVVRQWLGYACRDTRQPLRAFESFEAAWRVTEQLTRDFPDSAQCDLGAVRAGLDFIASFLVDVKDRPESEVCAVLVRCSDLLRASQRAYNLADQAADIDRLRAVLEEHRAALVFRGVHCAAVASSE